MSAGSEEARRGLASGSLSELVAYLNEGGTVDGELAKALAALLDPNGSSDWKVSIRQTGI